MEKQGATTTGTAATTTTSKRPRANSPSEAGGGEAVAESAAEKAAMAVEAAMAMEMSARASGAMPAKSNPPQVTRTPSSSTALRKSAPTAGAAATPASAGGSTAQSRGEKPSKRSKADEDPLKKLLAQRCDTCSLARSLAPAVVGQRCSLDYLPLSLLPDQRLAALYGNSRPYLALHPCTAIDSYTAHVIGATECDASPTSVGAPTHSRWSTSLLRVHCTRRTLARGS